MNKAQTLFVLPTKRHTASVIFSHGLGDEPGGFRFLLGEQLKNKFPYIKWIFPAAPIQPVTINGGMPCSSWFDLFGLSPDAREDEAGLLRSVRSISDLIADEVDAGIPSERVIVGGFSQGSVISLLTGITSERKLAGIVVFSGWLALSKKIEAMASRHARTTPILFGHGTVDPTVQYHWGQQSAAKLKEAGWKDIRFESYQGVGHTLHPKQLEDIQEFINKTIPNLD